jgi:hypothetical protein
MRLSLPIAQTWEPCSVGHTQCRAVGAAILIAPVETRAPAFADLKTPLVDYSKADMEPQGSRGNG